MTHADQPWGGGYTYSPLDSIVTSANEKALFYWHDEYIEPYSYTLLDSIEYKGFNDTSNKVKYYYEYASTDTTPWGQDSFISKVGSGYNNPCKATYLLNKVVYPNGDSVRYEYNDCYELTAAHTATGGVVRYKWKVDTFYVPEAQVYPPRDSCEKILSFTSGVDTMQLYDPWTAPDTLTTVFERHYRTLGLQTARSNADSVCIIDPNGNSTIHYYFASWTPGRDALTQWEWESGRMDSVVFYDSNNSLLEKRWTYLTLMPTDPAEGGDSIPVLGQELVYDGVNTYRTKYYEHDMYGNPHLIYQDKDTSTLSDDTWQRQIYYSASEDTHTSWLDLDFHSGGLGEWYADVEFSTLEGADTLIVIRHWWFGGNNTYDTIIHDFDPVCYAFDSSYVLKPYPGDQKYVEIYGIARYDDESLGVYYSLDLSQDPPEYYNARPETCTYHGVYDYDTKQFHSLLKASWISTDSAGTDTLQLTRFFYDDTNYIVRGYAGDNAPTQWENPSSPSIIRGNLTRMQTWEEGTDFTKNEFRYDTVGNVVMTIAHLNASIAETTFAYYDPPSNPDTFQYAYPWRSITHPVRGSNDSLCSRTEYDVSTGLAIRSVDVGNTDSIRYNYDRMGRVIEVWDPNESQSSKHTNYTQYQSSSIPAAVLDSVLQEGSEWFVSKTFYDGFGRVIQTQTFEDLPSGTDSAIVTSMSYNEQGQPDTVTNPYKIAVTGSFGTYSTPNWGSRNLTVTYYDALGRDTLIILPDNEEIISVYNPGVDTFYDEKGNRTVVMYNSLGLKDTVINALNDTTVFEYDYLGQLTKVRDASTGHKQTCYYYDNMGRLVATGYPDVVSNYTVQTKSVDHVFEYDDLGNVTVEKNPNGFVRYSYDNINRTTKVEFAPLSDTTDWSDKIRYSYDANYISGATNNPKGRLTKLVTVGIDSVRYAYDDKGRVWRKDWEVVGLSFPLGHAYFMYYFNEADQCTLSRAYPGAKSAKYYFDRVGRLEEIPGLVDEFTYTQSSQVKRIIFANSDTMSYQYNSRLQPSYIKAHNGATKYLELTYKYQENGNVDSIIDGKISAYTQVYTYDSLGQLLKVKRPNAADSQYFEYDKVGNRTKKNDVEYSYNSGTNKLDIDGLQGIKYYYDDYGNMIKREDTSTSTTIDTFGYNWNNQLIFYHKDTDSLKFAYNASGLRVMKKCFEEEDAGDGGGLGLLYEDESDDLGITSKGADSTFNKGRDIEKIYLKSDPNYYTFTTANQYLFSQSGKLKLFITVDIDTTENSGNISYPEDKLTKVPSTAAWEYCIYVDDEDYGLYKENSTKVSKPFGMLTEKVTGENGTVKVKVSKSLLSNPSAIRFTAATFDPSKTVNNDTLFQGGSTAADVFPGDPSTFGGEITGYGEVSSLGGAVTQVTTIYYLYGDGGIEPTVEYSANGSLLNRYIYGNGRHFCRLAQADADTYFYYCDALGSPRVMTDEGCTIKWQAWYWPFGEMTESGFTDNPHGFTGKEWDEEIGFDLNYFCQRYYDPEIGRFLAVDPLDSPGYSPYGYCANNPVRYIDRTGAEMREDYSLDGGGATGGYNPTGWGDPEGWKYMRSAQMDPDFWFKGWDWSPYHGNSGASEATIKALKEAMFILSSGIYEWDVLTTNGWAHINIGQWLKANNAMIIHQPVNGGFVNSYDPLIRMVVDVGSANNVFDLAALIAHEATHLLANNGGNRPGKKYETSAMLADLLDDGARNYSIVTANRKMQELWATGVMLDLFKGAMSPNFQQGVLNYLNLYQTNIVWHP